MPTRVLSVGRVSALQKQSLLWYSSWDVYGIRLQDFRVGKRRACRGMAIARPAGKNAQGEILQKECLPGYGS
eukprot:364454-Chlamydomonas_euryale.AAC.3